MTDNAAVWTAALVLILCLFCLSASAVDPEEVIKVARKAPRLPPPQGNVVHVNDINQLYGAIRSGPGTTILIADGHYYLPRLLRLQRNGITIRGASGNRDKVIIDGSRCESKELIWFEGGDDCMAADLTIQNAPVHGFTVKGESDTQRTRIYNCVIKNVWERGVKGTAPRSNPESVRPTGGRIEYCLFVNDHKKTENDWTGGDYIAGMDMMWLKDWVISDNVFIGIQGRNGVGRAAIFIWNNSDSVVAERNLIVDCDRGIAFGNPSGGNMHMSNAIVRNNFIVGGVNTAIEICRTRNVKVYNNTIWGTRQNFRFLVHFFQGSEGDAFVNNLVHGQTNLEQGVENRNNFTGGLNGYFVNPAAGDLHLTSAAVNAINKGIPLPEITNDFDGYARGPAPDIGACEFGAREAALVAQAAKEKRPASASARPAEAQNPLTEHQDALVAAADLASNGNLEAASSAYRETASKLPDGLHKNAVLALAEGCKTSSVLVSFVVKGVKEKGPKRVIVDFLGSPQRMQIVDADERKGTYEFGGDQTSIEWNTLSPKRLADIAEKYVSFPGEHVTLARFALAVGDIKTASKAVALAREAGPTQDDTAIIEALGVLLPEEE